MNLVESEEIDKFEDMLFGQRVHYPEHFYGFLLFFLFAEIMVRHQEKIDKRKREGNKTPIKDFSKLLKIISMRAGLDGSPPMTVKECGEALGVSRSRASGMIREARYELKQSVYTYKKWVEHRKQQSASKQTQAGL